MRNAAPVTSAEQPDLGPVRREVVGTPRRPPLQPGNGCLVCHNVAGFAIDEPAASAPRANSHATRRAETVLPSTFSFPTPSLVLDPVQM